MEQIVIVIHVIVAIMVIALVLVQHGKGADAGATFGGGASNTMFGSQGAMPFLMKVTSSLAVIFFATNLTLGYLTGHATVQSSDTLSTPVTASPNSVNNKPAQQEIVFPSMNASSKIARK